MFITTTKRIIKAGFTSFWRNGFVSLSSVLAMTVALIVIGAVIFSSVALKGMLQDLRNKADFNIYFLTTAEEKEILSLKTEIQKLPEVKEVTYLSREDALNEFKAKHGDNEQIMQALSIIGDNPLGARLTVKAHDVSQYDSIVKFLSGEDTALSSANAPIIDKIDYFQNKKRAIDQLSRIATITERVGLIIALFLIFISIIITFNTIRLVTYISRDEIAVMTLVGASRRYVRWPFVVSGMLYGVTASIISILVYYIASFWIEQTTGAFFTGILPFQFFVAHMGQISVIILFAGIILGGISSYLAVRRYLKV